MATQLEYGRIVKSVDYGAIKWNYTRVGQRRCFLREKEAGNGSLKILAALGRGASFNLLLLTVLLSDQWLNTPAFQNHHDVTG